MTGKSPGNLARLIWVIIAVLIVILAVYYVFRTPQPVIVPVQQLVPSDHELKAYAPVAPGTQPSQNKSNTQGK